jgi:glycosyltransferase involved in cell wall biosynthesis
MSKRILVVIDSLYTGGAEYSTLQFYGWLQQKGSYTVEIVCLKHASPSYDPDDFQLSAPHYIIEKNFFKRVRFLGKLIKAFQPDLVHSVLYQSNLLTRICNLFICRFQHLESLVNETYSPYRVNEQGVSAFKLLFYRFADILTQIRGTQHYHANGNAVALHYQQYVKVPVSKISVVPRGRKANPFYSDDLNRERIRTTFHTGDRLLIVNTARHEFQKGQELLIGCIERMKRKGFKVQLIIAGREGKSTPHLQEEIIKIGLQEDVILAGHRSDLASILAAADLFVFPSRFEGLPGALIEAEAAGLPILASDIPNNREVAQEEKNALFFPVDNVDVLTLQMERLVLHPELRQKMSNASIQIFKERYTLEIIHPQMEALFEQLLEKR